MVTYEDNESSMRRKHWTSFSKLKANMLEETKNIPNTLHGMGAGVHRDVSLSPGHELPPQLGFETIVRVLLLVPLFTLHRPGGAEQELQPVQMET